MDLDRILNSALNKAMIGRDRIKQVNSNEIADFVNKYLEAINYSQCCETLEMEHAATSEEYAEAIIDMNKNPQDSNSAFKKVVLENAIDKFKQDLSKL